VSFFETPLICSDTLRLAARNTPSGSPGFSRYQSLALAFPSKRAKSCHCCDRVRRCSMIKLAPSVLLGESYGRF
jgi:hypothetical protein